MGWEVVGDTLSRIGTGMMQREWDKQDRAAYMQEQEALRRADREERARYEAPKQQTREEVRDGKRVNVTYEWDVSGDRGQWKEVAAQPIEATVKGVDEIKVGDEIRSYERLSDGTRRPLMVDDGKGGKVNASAPRYRPSSGAAPRQPKRVMMETPEGMIWVEEGAPIPPNARRPGGKGGAAGLTTQDAVSLIQTYRKNLEVTYDDSGKERTQTVREAMAADGLDYDAVLARANGKDPSKAKPKGKSPLMAVADTVMGAGRKAMSAATSPAPQGMKLVGHTPDGKPVYEDQSGQRFVDD